LARQLGLEQHITFSTGLMPTAELPTFLRQADAGLVPYRRDPFTDGILPTKLMEYVALGLPVIAARTPAIERYFDETMVQYFRPGDPADLARSILELYNNRDRMAELVANSDRFNQQYSWTRVSSDYVALVERLGR
jgi:glycosyltransferase involved in cell wall biosynthesis